MTRNQRIRKLTRDSVTDLVGDFLYYDRKDDEDLKLGMIQEGIVNGAVSVDELVALFRVELIKQLTEL